MRRCCHLFCSLPCWWTCSLFPPAFSYYRRKKHVYYMHMCILVQLLFVSWFKWIKTPTFNLTYGNNNWMILTSIWFPYLGRGRECLQTPKIAPRGGTPALPPLGSSSPSPPPPHPHTLRPLPLSSQTSEARARSFALSLEPAIFYFSRKILFILCNFIPYNIYIIFWLKIIFYFLIMVDIQYYAFRWHNVLSVSGVEPGD